MNKWRLIGSGVAILVIGALLWRANRAPDAIHAASARSNEQIMQLADGAAPTDPAPSRRYRIGVLFPFIAAPFWVNEAYGVLDQAKRVGVDVVWLSADGYDNIDKQNSQIEALVSQRVDAIILGATSSAGTVPAVERAVEKGIPVFAHVTSSATDRITAAVLDDDDAIGRRQAQFMGQALHGQGQVAMLSGPAAADWSSRRARSFKAVMAAEFPNIKIVAERHGIPDRADAQRLAEDLLVGFPDLAGLFAVADGMAMGAADAAIAAQRIDRITITTASFSRETVPYLTAGHIDVNVDENPVLMGRTALNTVVRALNGEAVPKITYVPSPAITRDKLAAVDEKTQWAPEDWHLK
jgi:ribose transport system substrate-binding protein